MRFGIFLIALFAGLAIAQVPAPAPKENKVERPQPMPEKEREVPDAEKIRRSSESLVRMRIQYKESISRLEEARRTKDVLRLNCINEKVVQIKGLLRICETSDGALQESVSKGESSAAAHEFTKVTISRGKVDQLRAEIEQCIGQLAFVTDENLLVEVEVPTDLPTGDPTRPASIPPIAARPPPASPTL